MTKFLLVDDYRAAREDLRLAVSTLANDVTVLNVGDVSAALATIPSHSDIDLVVLDIDLPDAGTFSLVQQLWREQNTVSFVILCGLNERNHVLEALKLDDLHFNPRVFSLELILQAIRLVVAGATYIPSAALPTRRNLCNALTNSGATEHLTARQKQILALMARGMPNKLIADELDISESTVKSHVTEILRMLGVTNRTQAAIAAADLGIT